MANLTHIELIYYKNHQHTSFSLHPRINCFLGKNGCGKTNLLDAVHYLCFARSYFTKVDKFIPYAVNSGFSVKGSFEHTTASHINCIYREDGKKELYINKELIPKTSAFIGKNSCVMIAPDDIAIINEGSENRRRWLDMMFCQVDKTYLQQLQQYQKVITQRNALLKLMAEKNERTNTILDFYNEALQQAAAYIFTYRLQHFTTLVALITKKYKWIAASMDDITVTYQSQLSTASLTDLLQQNLAKDLATQRTNYGIHKDDLIFTMSDDLVKNRASQGQKKSFLLALKIAELEWLSEQLGYTPILLLDDIFERLDATRIHNLFSYISTTLNSQVLITDTDANRIEKALQPFTSAYTLFTIDNH